MLNRLRTQRRLGPVHLVKRILADRSTRSSAILMASSVLASGLAFLFTVSVARLLGPGEYSILGVSLSVYYILAVAITPVSNVISKLTAESKAASQEGQITFIISIITSKGLVAGGLIFLAVALFSRPLSSLLNIASPLPVILIGLLFWAALLLQASRGILQGLQEFSYLAISTSLEAFMRLSAGLLLVTLGLGVNGAILGFVSAASLSFILILLLLRRRYHSAPRPVHFPGLHRYGSSALLLSVCFAAAQNMDVIVVKHYFGAEEAGIYVAATLIARLLSMFSIPFYQVMFPRVVAAKAQNEKTSPILVKTLVLIGLTCALFVGASWSFGNLLVHLSFGAAYASTAALLGPYGLAQTLSILTGTICTYQLALARSDFEVPLISGVGILFVLLMQFHQSLEQVVAMIILTNGAVLAIMVIREVTHRYK